MIKKVRLIAQVELENSDESLQADIELQPGYPMYSEAGELAALEEMLGLSVASKDGQCVKICLGDLFSPECFESILLELLNQIQVVEDKKPQTSRLLKGRNTK